MLLSSRCGLRSVISCEDAHEVALGARIVVRPRRVAPEAAAGAAVLQPDEGEMAVVGERARFRYRAGGWTTTAKEFLPSAGIAERGHQP